MSDVVYEVKKASEQGKNEKASMAQCKSTR